MKRTLLILTSSALLTGLAAAQTEEPDVPMGDALFSLFDGDGDGSVSAEEFTLGMFNRSDLDGSGSLSRVEFNGGKDLFYDGRYEGGDFVPDFDTFDADGNGEVSEGEFSAGSEGENYEALYEDFDGDGSGGDGRLSVVDVGVVEEPGGEGVAVPPGVRTTVTPAAEVLANVPVRLLNVRVSNEDDDLVCLVEILSPANKRQNRGEFLRKRLNLLHSPAGLVEIDLLRRGRRVCGDSAGGPPVRVPVGTAYMTLVSRPWERDGVNARGTNFRLLAYFLRLNDQLPVVPVPLREGESDVPLDLQYCFNEMYDGGPFLREADRYDRPPDPPLPPAAAEWAADRIAAWRTAA